MIEFILYDDSDLVLATTEAEVNRTTTSNKFISLDQKEQIINTLILDALIDISLKTGELLNNLINEKQINYDIIKNKSYQINLTNNNSDLCIEKLIKKKRNILYYYK